MMVITKKKTTKIKQHREKLLNEQRHVNCVEEGKNPKTYKTMKENFCKKK